MTVESGSQIESVENRGEVYAPEVGGVVVPAAVHCEFVPIAEDAGSVPAETLGGSGKHVEGSWSHS